MDKEQCRYDITGLARELDVDLGDIAILFVNYFVEMKSEIAEMQRFLSEKDWNMLERTVHNIKGVSVNLGVLDVYNEAEAFDRLLKDGNTDHAEEYVNKVSRLLGPAEIEVKRFFNRNGLSM